MSVDERDLGRRFSRLREEERHVAPAFDRALRRVRGQGRTPRRPPFPVLLPAALLAVTAVGVLVLYLRAPRPAAPDDLLVMARALSTWEAPTDAILRLSNVEIPAEVPDLSLTSVGIPELPAPDADRSETELQ